jgi:small subunit ribosomal protein S4e
MSKHMKRLASPRVWSIPKKSHKWATKPSAGPHPEDRSIPLRTLLRDVLQHCDTAREAQKIIAARDILIDGKGVRKGKHPVGLMDVISIPKTKQNFRMLIDARGKLRLKDISMDRSKWKLCRIEGKTTVRGGKTQLNLHDGRNVLVEKSEYKPGDVLKLEIPSQKIVDTLQLKEGNMAIVIGGKHAGEIGTIKKYEVIKGPAPNIIWFKEEFSTTKDNVFIVGTKKSEIQLLEVKAYD